jgi:hypothetical protein
MLKESIQKTNQEIIEDLINNTQGITQIFNAIYKPDLTSTEKSIRAKNRTVKLHCLIENLEQLNNSRYPNSETTPIEEALSTVINPYFSKEFCKMRSLEECSKALELLKTIEFNLIQIKSNTNLDNLRISIKNLEEMAIIPIVQINLKQLRIDAAENN